ncbi:Asp23/Gls24 family envelope stress response protein [Streptomyces tremellae]|uniref:Asp23/Gls24 family envelope stress response protein n=1 Tax=Streptomyces tremellae TaxID=1124239 RepID=A0ABP7FPA2_9ACTN
MALTAGQIAGAIVHGHTGGPRAEGTGGTKDEIARRGETTVSGRAAGRIAAQAAREALVPHPHAGAQATADTRRGRTKIALEIDLPYPLDIDAVCARVRQHVAERTAALTGIPVVSVDVLVGRLTPVRALNTERVV